LEVLDIFPTPHRAAAKARLPQVATATVIAGVLAVGGAGGALAGVLRVSPQQSEGAFMKAAQAAAASGDVNSAVAYYQRAADAAPKDPTPFSELGALMVRTGSLGGAVEAYRGALARAPSDWRLDLELGRLALRLDQPQEAVGHFETARQEHPEPAVWNGLGVSYDLLGDHLRAQGAYAEGLKTAPDDGPLRNNLGLSQALSGNYPAAIATLSALAASPQATTRYRLNLALAYGLAGDDEKAAAAAREDLGQAEIDSNRRYYQTLRTLGDHARSEAILGNGAAGHIPVPPAPPTSR
jgi:Flp pilus assembly protein TadD